MPINQNYLTTEQAAVYLGISKKTLESYRQEGTGPRYIMVSSKLIRYLIADLDAWMQSFVCYTRDQHDGSLLARV